MSKKSKTIIRNFAVVMSLIICFSISYVTSFAMAKDLDGHWASNVINEWFDKGLAGGYSDDTFRPNANITRAEFMTLVNNAFEKTSEIQINFSDVKSNDWYYKTVQKALAAGYIGGYPDGTMRPNQAITRQEAAVIISRVKMLTQKDISKAPFNDDKMISDWSKGYVNAVITAHIMNGYPDNTFKPNEKISRAEAIVALDNAMNYVASKDIKSEATVFAIAGVYGPESGAVAYSSDVVIDNDGITLQNCTISGDLVISEKVGNGDVILNNVIVMGNTYVRGGGANSIHLNQGQYKQIIVEKFNSDQVRIVSNNAKNIQLVIAETAAQKKVALEGTFDSVALNAKNFELSTGGSTTIKNLTINKSATDNIVRLDKNTIVEKLKADVALAVKGKGLVKIAELNALNVTFETEPSSKNLTVPSSTGSSAGGGSSNSGGNDKDNTPSNIPLDNIVFTQTSLTLLAGGTTESIQVSVTPENATDKSIIWSSNDTSIATVEGGVVTPLKAGVVTITATSKADQTKTASCNVTVQDTVGVSEVSKFVEAINATGVKAITLTDNLVGDVVSVRTGATDFTVNFGEFSLTGNMSLTADNVSEITFNTSGTEDSIIGNLTVSAPAATVNNHLNISGKIIIQAISNHTWNQAGNANGIEITANGGAFNFENGNLGTGITVNPSNNTRALVLEGDLRKIPMRISKPSILEIASDAQPPAIAVDPAASGSAIDNFSNTPVDLTTNAPIFVGGNMTSNSASTVAPTVRQLKPKFSPRAGKVIAGTVVTISAMGADQIYYTTDGSTPKNVVNGSTKVYTTPITISSDQTIKAIATKNGQVESAVSMAEYTVEAVRVSSIKLSSEVLTMTEGSKTITITASVLPANAMNKAILWETSDPNVVTVNEGVITPVGIGTAIISVTSVDNNSISAHISVTVQSKTAYSVELTDTFNVNTGLNITKDIKLMKDNQLVTGGYVIENSTGIIVGKDTDGDGITRLPCALNDGNLKIKLADGTVIPVN